MLGRSLDSHILFILLILLILSTISSLHPPVPMLTPSRLLLRRSGMLRVDGMPRTVAVDKDVA